MASQDHSHAPQAPNALGLSTAALSPLDWGLSLAFSYRWTLLLLVSVVLAVEVFCDYLVYSRPLVPKQHFLLWAIYCTGNAWLLTSIQMFFIERMKYRSDPKILAVAMRAFANMPKVVLSYGTLMMFFAVYFRFPPFLVLLVFFMWAPTFCIGELYAKPDPVDELSEFDEESDEDLLLRRAKEATAAFKYKNFTELGFVRSVRFVTHNKPLSFQLALLYWCAEVVPRGVITLTSGPVLSYVDHALGLALATVASAFVIAASAIVFMLALPARVLKEIDVTIDMQALDLPRSGIATRSHSGIMRYGLAAVLAAGFSWYLFNQSRLEAAIPASVQIKLSETRWQEESLMIAANITDTERDFRWLDPANFRLRLDGRASEANKSDTKGIEKTLLEPRLTSVYSESGEKLSKFQYKPFYRPLKVLLYFDVPRSARSEKDGAGSEGAERQNDDRRKEGTEHSFSLYYSAPDLALGPPLLHGEIPERPRHRRREP